MIVFETGLASVLNQLPPVVDAKGVSHAVRFDWGSEELLNQFLLLPESRSKYPLIWLVNGVDQGTYNYDPITRQTRLIIATRSNTVGEFNPFAFQTDFAVILDPILSNVFTALERSGITGYGKYSISRLPNYSQNKSENATVDIWNAIVLDVEITMRGDRKLKTIKF